MSAIAYQLAGGTKRFYELPRERRLALREHAQFLHTRGASFTSAAEQIEASVKEGFVYIITNPAFPGFVKIGCAINVCSRLADYQTYCPFRRFKLEHEVYTTDRRQAEATVHSLFADRRAMGEWFRVSVEEAREMLDAVREFDPRAFVEET